MKLSTKVNIVHLQFLALFVAVLNDEYNGQSRIYLYLLLRKSQKNCFSVTSELILMPDGLKFSYTYLNENNLNFSKFFRPQTAGLI